MEGINRTKAGRSIEKYGADSRTREELADDADDGPAGPVGALDAHDLELLEVGEAGVGLGLGEVGEAVVPVLAVGVGEERGACVGREVGAQHEHGEVALTGGGGARRHRRGVGWGCRSQSQRPLLSCDWEAGRPLPIGRWAVVGESDAILGLIFIYFFRFFKNIC